MERSDPGTCPQNTSQCTESSPKGEPPPPQALSRPLRGWTARRGRVAGAGMAQHGQPAHCLPARRWCRDVTMVPAGAAAAAASWVSLRRGGICVRMGVLLAVCESLFVLFSPFNSVHGKRLKLL